jgi:hypothetical protein
VRGKPVGKRPGHVIGPRQKTLQALRPPDLEQAAQIRIGRLGRVNAVEQPFQRRRQECDRGHCLALRVKMILRQRRPA